ncbi:MAG: c-type cytochrome domain-containing protein [Syntrophobacter sp.]
MKYEHLSIAMLFLAAIILCIPTTGLAQTQPQSKGVSYSEIAPILQNRCLNCHSGAKAAKGLHLDTYENIIKGSNDEKVVVPGQPAKSSLLLRLTGAKTPRMPRNGPPWVSNEDIALIEKWIASGAPR